jgi:hypothetical protein
MQEAARNAPVICGVCGETRRRCDFKSHKYQTHFNPLCNACLRSIKTEAKRLVAARPVPMQARQAAYKLLLERARRANAEGKEVNCVSQEEYAARMLQFPDKVAAAVTKTAVYVGDAETLSASAAMVFIHDLLYELDPQILERNRAKKPKGFDATNIKALH